MKDLLKLTKKYASGHNVSSNESAAEEVQVSGNQKTLQGGMGSASRAQPRYQSGKASTYDKK